MHHLAVREDERAAHAGGEVLGVDPARGRDQGAELPEVFALGRADNDFAESASLTDLSQSGGKFLEAKGAVDVDPYRPGNAEVGNRLEVGRPLHFLDADGLEIHHLRIRSHHHWQMLVAPRNNSIVKDSWPAKVGCCWSLLGSTSDRKVIVEMG
jgi:hypothetical protein